ncbi:MAG: hypothetical protein OXC62_06295 [Aestuariivita sp.]|nr:hypothetical protein [Aestuariivita sp.]
MARDVRPPSFWAARFTVWHRAAALFQRRRTQTAPNPSRRTDITITAVTDRSVSSPGLSCLIAPDGSRLMAGLTWDIASGSELPTLTSNTPLILRMPHRRTTLPQWLSVVQNRSKQTEQCAIGSLLLDLATGLLKAHPTSSGPWVFIADVPGVDDDRPLVWLAVADVGNTDDRDHSATIVPRPGQEHLFETANDALATFHKYLDVIEIAGLAVRWFPAHSITTSDQTHRGAMIDGFSHIARDLPLYDIALQSGDADIPVFAPPTHIPVPLLVSVLGAAALVAVLLFIAIPFVQHLLREPPPPPVLMVNLHPKPGAFAEACVTNMNDWWPRIVGWDVLSTGCAVEGYVPNDVNVTWRGAGSMLAQPMVVWRQLAPEVDRNSVLARSAADQAIAAWPSDARYDDLGRLTLWKTVDLPLVTLDDTVLLDSPAPETWQSQLAVLFADTPNSVKVNANQLIITAPGRPREAFRRAAHVSGLTPVRFEQPGNLVLMPITPRRVPMTDIDDEEALQG